MIGKIYNVIQNTKDGIAQATLFGRIKNGKLAIWWQYGIPLIAKRITSMITVSNLSITGEMYLIAKKILHALKKSTAGFAPTHDMLIDVTAQNKVAAPFEAVEPYIVPIDARIQNDVDAPFGIAPPADLDVNYSIRYKLRTGLYAETNIADLRYFGRSDDGQYKVDLYPAPGVTAAATRIMTGSYRLRPSYIDNTKGKARRRVKMLLASKAEQAQTANDGRHYETISVRVNAEGEHAPTLNEYQFDEIIQPSVNAEVKHAPIVDGGKYKEIIPFTVRAKTAEAPLTSGYTNSVVQFDPSLDIKTAPGVDIGTKNIQISSHLAAVSVREGWHQAVGDTLFIYQTRFAKQEDAVLHLDGAAGVYWIDPIQTGTELHIQQVYRAMREDSALHIDGSVADAWKKPTAEGTNLTVKQAFEATQDGDKLEVI